MSLYIGLMSGTSIDGIDAVLLQVGPAGMALRAATHQVGPSSCTGGSSTPWPILPILGSMNWANWIEAWAKSSRAPHSDCWPLPVNRQARCVRSAATARRSGTGRADRSRSHFRLAIPT